MSAREPTVVTIERYGQEPIVRTISTLNDAFDVLDELGPGDNEARLVQGTHCVEFTYLAYFFEAKQRALGVSIADAQALEAILFALFEGFRREGDMIPNETSGEVHVWNAIHPTSTGGGCFGLRMHWRFPREAYAELDRLLRERADGTPVRESSTWYGLD